MKLATLFMRARYTSAVMVEVGAYGLIIEEDNNGAYTATMFYNREEVDGVYSCETVADIRANLAGVVNDIALYTLLKEVSRYE